MFSSGNGQNEYYTHHTSLQTFTKAAADGCLICAPLLRYFRKEIDDLVEHYRPDRLRCDWRISGNLDGQAVLTMRIEHPYAYYFYIAPKTMLPLRTGVCGRRSAIPLTQSIQAAQEWMRSCLDKHEQCQKNTQPHAYPTRLLELEDHNIRLIIPQGDKPSGPYAALSYCWGPNPSFIRLTADNLQEFRVTIPYTGLPIAFREAVQITKTLGIRYLWIDALCIVQSGSGSSEDWQFECGRMQEVYSKCIINISLAQSAHPNQSCLGGHTLDSILPFETDITYKADALGTKETHTFTVLSQDYFREALYRQPIGSRAWVMQERLLATRVLTVGHGELFWDCQQVPHASEFLPEGFAFFSNAQRDWFSKALDLSIPFLPRTSNSEDLEKNWSGILEEYTARELTYPEADKLVALSAIATRMSHAMNDTYLCGHFYKTLPRSLNWKAWREISRRSRIQERVVQRLPKISSQVIGERCIITPSWSWASMDGQLHTARTQGRSSTFVAVMETYKFSPARQTAPEAQLEDKFLLTIRTLCRTIEWRISLRDIFSGPEINIEELGDTHFVMDDVRDIPADGSQCLLAALTQYRGWVEGLLLRDVQFDGDTVYERIGHFRCRQDWRYSLRDGTWRDFFTQGERSITLC
jgi:hypothetical protein